MRRKFVLMVIALAIGLSACQKKETPIDPKIDQDLITFSEEIIPDSWIIVYNDINNLKKMPADVDGRNDLVLEVSKDVFKRASVEFTQPTYVYSSSIIGLSMNLSDEEALRLKDDSDVKGVYPNKVITLGRGGGGGGGGGNLPPDPPEPVNQVVPWGIERTVYEPNTTYAGTNKAWIIDTGIDFDHPDLNVDASLAFHADGLRTRITPGDDDNGHGTHCAGIVAAKDNDQGVVGVAAGATVIPVKVLDKRGSGATDGIIAGIDYVAANAADGDVANLSLGGGVYEPLDLAVIALGNAGVLVALAAGNEEDDAMYHSPARADGDNLFTISAMGEGDLWAYFSNYGADVEFCAPGYLIYSTYKDGAYATMSGTSMSSPHVCGLLLLTNNNIATDGYVIGDPDGNADPIAHN